MRSLLALCALLAWAGGAVAFQGSSPVTGQNGQVGVNSSVSQLGSCIGDASGDFCGTTDFSLGSPTVIVPTVNGSAASGGSLTLQSSTHSTKGALNLTGYLVGGVASIGASSSVTPGRSLVTQFSSAATVNCMYGRDGSSAPTNGEVVLLVNGTVSNITLTHNAGSGNCAGFGMTDGANETLESGQAVLCVYVSFWRCPFP